MRKFLSFVSLQILILSAALLTIHVFGARQPSPLASLFTNPDGSPCEMPCIFGITETTPYDEAIRLVKDHPLGRNLKFFGDYQDYFAAFASQKAVIAIWPGYKDSVYQIDISLDTRILHVALGLDETNLGLPPTDAQLQEIIQNLTLGQVIIHLKEPKAWHEVESDAPIIIINGSSHFRIYGEHYVFDIVAPPVKLSAEIQGITFFPTQPGKYSGFCRWKGFLSSEPLATRCDPWP